MIFQSRMPAKGKAGGDERYRFIFMYICIDLKSFYASVECVERGLDPMTTRLVVADPERQEGTICLAITPAMKALGVKNRCRVFQIPKNIDYIMAPPRMQKYIDYSAEIYGVYLKYISPDDIHVYSIDEVFMDVQPYMKRYNRTAKEIALMLMEEVRENVGVRATAGVGTNLYLTKIALDVTAKHSPDNIGELDEESYKQKLWDHRPLTDFWRIGKATAKTLEGMGIRTMRQLAHADEDMLYKKFGVDAELLIDHAWGREPVQMEHIKNFRSKSTSLTSGQVLMRDYTVAEARLIVAEMVDSICIDMASKCVLTESVSLSIGYSHNTPGETSRGTAHFTDPTDSYSEIAGQVLKVYDCIVNRKCKVRRMNISCNDLKEGNRQLTITDIFEEKKDKKIQKAMLDIKNRFGKSAVFRARDLQEEATALDRHKQIGGHKSGET